MMNGWLWLIAAFVLAGVELLVPGWAFMGLAASVGLMGVLLLTGVWTAGLPVTLVALLISIEPLIEMGRTALNVNGSMTAGALTSRWLGMTDRAVQESDEHAELAHR